MQPPAVAHLFDELEQRYGSVRRSAGGGADVLDFQVLHKACGMCVAIRLPTALMEPYRPPIWRRLIQGCPTEAKGIEPPIRAANPYLHPSHGTEVETSDITVIVRF